MRRVLGSRLMPAFVVAVAAVVVGVVGAALAAPAGPNRLAHIASRGPRGPRGFRGFRGFTGARGPRGFDGAPGRAGDIPQLKIVESKHETLNPGQSTYDVDPNGFEASCPSGYTVIGTGFNTGIGRVDTVLNYGGFFVGGFIDNNTGIQISDVYVQATCGVVPGGVAAAADGHTRDSFERQYRAALVRHEAQVHHH